MSGAGTREVAAGSAGSLGGRVHGFLIHKRGDHVGVATSDIRSGERVIGVAPDGFGRGDYVHTHNLKSARW